MMALQSGQVIGFLNLIPAGSTTCGCGTELVVAAIDRCDMVVFESTFCGCSTESVVAAVDRCDIVVFGSKSFELCYSARLVQVDEFGASVLFTVGTVADETLTV